MKAIILAAGYGARMKPYTDTKPKALLEVAGQTIIGRMLNLLIARGISDICVVTGYCREQLEDYLRTSYPNLNLTFVFNEVFYRTNNIYSMHLALENFPLDDDVLLIESDLIFSVEVLDRILQSQHENVALVDRFKTGMDGTVVTVEDDLILNVIPPHLQGPGFDFSDKYKTLNIYKFSSKFLQTSFKKLLSFYATVYNDNCYYELILGILIYMRHEQIFACDVAGANWFEIDDPNDLRLAEIKFYESGFMEKMDEAFGGFWNIPIIDFAFIRNMYFPNDSIIADIKHNLPLLMQNYGSSQIILNEKLSHFLQIPFGFVCLLNGLSQIYPILKDLYGEKSVLIPEPTFGEYLRVFPNALKYKDEGLQTLTDIPIHLIELADVIIFVNPNNPTGSCIDSAEIIELARSEPTKTIIVDESFIEFSEQPSVQELLKLDELKNVIILKSLSKSLGIPGLRIGYIYSRDKETIYELNKRIPIWNTNSIAEYFLEIILKHRSELNASINSTIIDRNLFAQQLSELPFIEKVYPSKANFILVRLKIEQDQLIQLRSYLFSEWNIYIKDLSLKLNDGGSYIRLAVRLPHENLELINALQQSKFC
ncbi:MAG: aminotransferase class I/II-fold pyridoxal phosphate-dependent enzyme [Candidatus Cloacimonetes bacterium]|nr:aminotransferase class I/II-fold pyridoxal phosphate-dependent enzyme [Candidatus Cloacimonadota bacterium]